MTRVNKLPKSVIPFLPEMIKTQTLQDIGDAYGVGRERIRQVLKLQGIDVSELRESQRVKCSTPGCPKRIPFSLRLGRDKCNACIAYSKRTSKRRFRRRFEPKSRCIVHPDRIAAYGLKKQCGSCRIKAYLQTPKGKIYLKRIRESKTYKEYQRSYRKKQAEEMKRNSMASPNDQGWGHKHTSSWLKNYYTGA